MIKVLPYLLFFLGFTLQAIGATYTATLYPIDSDREKVLYTYKHENSTEGKAKTFHNKYTDTEGKDVVLETVKFENGDLVEYHIDHKQINESGKIVVKDKKVIFYHTEDGETSETSIPKDPSFVVGPTLLDYMRANWDKLMRGDSVKVHYGVWNREEAIWFKLKKRGELQVDGKNAVNIEFAANSFVIRTIMGRPVNFYLEKESKKLLVIKGRTLPKKKKWGRWRDLNAEIVFKYQ